MPPDLAFSTIHHMCSQPCESVTMSSQEHLHGERCLRSLREVADSLGVTRAAVNFMVHDDRLQATRLGARWYVCEHELEDFRAEYRPAPSAGRKLGPRSGHPEMVDVVHGLLSDWGEARVDELSEVIGRDPGNVRKYLAILQQRGLAQKTSHCTWAPIARADLSPRVKQTA